MNPNFPVYLAVLKIYCCVERKFSSEIRGYDDDDDYDDCCHLICDVMCTDRNVLTFHMLLPPPSSVSVLQFSVPLSYIFPHSTTE